MIKSGSCIWFTLIACLAGIIMAKAFPCGAETSVLPFCQGEELIYDVRWEMISAGRARFRVNRISGLNGMKARHFTLELESNHYIDMLYKIRDRVEGFTDTGFTRSVFYRKTQSGKDKKQIEIHFLYHLQFYLLHLALKNYHKSSVVVVIGLVLQFFEEF